MAAPACVFYMYSIWQLCSECTDSSCSYRSIFNWYVAHIQSIDGLSCPQQHHTQVFSHQHCGVIVDPLFPEQLQFICTEKSALLHCFFALFTSHMLATVTPCSRKNAPTAKSKMLIYWKLINLSQPAEKEMLKLHYWVINHSKNIQNCSSFYFWFSPQEERIC